MKKTMRRPSLFPLPVRVQERYNRIIDILQVRREVRNMAKTLVLVRHGKAQEAVEGLPDDDRALTSAGIRALEAWLPRSFALLELTSDDTLQVWTSPSLRAEQTAEGVAWVLDEPPILPCESLRSQDIEAFLAELSAASADCVVAVGHNPFMEEMAGILCGSKIPFSTGAVAAFEIPDMSHPADARLLWVVQGPDVERWKTLCTLEKIMKKSAKRIEDRLAAFLEEPDDVEALHALRVSIRMMRSLLVFIEPYQKSKQNVAMQHALRGIVLGTSRLRELDVLCEQAEELDPLAADLLEACSQMRRAERDALIEMLQSKETTRALACVEKACRRYAWKDVVDENGLAPEELRQRFEHLLELLNARMAQADLAEIDPIHELRKDAKRVRYAAESLAQLLGDRAEAEAQRMMDVQDKLGALCDARVNLDIIAAFPVEGLSDRARWDLSILKARNEEFVFTTLRHAARL